MKTKPSRKNKLANNIRLLVGAILLTIIIGASLNVAFADRDIASMLTNWFDKNRIESIAKIETAIETEKDLQIMRLKEELRLEIEQAKEQLEQFTESEKMKRVSELQSYADALIGNLTIDNTEDKSAIIQQYEAILQEAMQKMDMVQVGDGITDEDSGNDEDGTQEGNDSSDNTDETDVKNEPAEPGADMPDNDSPNNEEEEHQEPTDEVPNETTDPGEDSDSAENEPENESSNPSDDNDEVSIKPNDNPHYSEDGVDESN